MGFTVGETVRAQVIKQSNKYMLIFMLWRRRIGCYKQE